MTSLAFSKGMTEADAALLLSLYALISFPVTLITGRVSDRVKQNYVCIATLVSELVAVACIFFAGALPLAVVGAVFHGIAHGLYIVNNGVVWPNYFGTGHLGAIKSVATCGLVFGAAVGPLPLGLLYGRFGDYTAGLLILMALPLIGIVLAYFSKKPQPPGLFE
jgi:predicted MFS family arabinose efflux permease